MHSALPRGFVPLPIRMIESNPKPIMPGDCEYCGGVRPAHGSIHHDSFCPEVRRNFSQAAAYVESLS